VSLNLEFRQRPLRRQPPPHARPPRTTRQSCRLRASDRTIVGIFDPRLTCRASRRCGRCLDCIMNSAGPVNIVWLPYSQGAGRRSELLLPVSGENFLLTSPFIELQGVFSTAILMTPGRQSRKECDAFPLIWTALVSDRRLSAPPRRSARHPSSSEEGSFLRTPLLIQEGWRPGRRGG
jgi:hypothetical protein